jgi:hypothetical protein
MNDLMTLDLNQLPATQLGSDQAFDETAKGSDFLGRLQLFSKQTEVTEGLIGAGRYGVKESATEITDLGASCDVLPLARRHKAVDMSDREAIVANYNPESAEYQRIVATSAGKNSGCMHGISFLVFERKTGRFLEFYCGSESARRAAKQLYPYLPLTAADLAAKRAANVDTTGLEPHGPQPITLKCDLIKKQDFKWHVPLVNKCSTPFTNLPSMERIVKEITKFLTVKDDGIETVDASTAGQRVR